MQMRLLTALPIAAALMISCKDKNKGGTEELPPEIPVVEVVEQDTTLRTAFVANIRALRNTEIRSRVHGFLEKVLVDEGHFVKSGQPLFQLSTGEYRIDVAKAEAALASAVAESKTAELEMERVTSLVERNVITRTEKDLAKAKLQVAEAKIAEARAALEEAKLKLGYTVIRAPFSGIVNRIPLRLGSLIEAGTLLTTLSDVSQVYAYFTVSENDYLRFSSDPDSAKFKRREVELVLSDGTVFDQKGLIETMEGEFDESTGAIAFRARFTNPSSVLKHGATGKILLTNDERGVLMIPQKAVFEIQDRYFVFVVKPSGEIEQRSFEPKLRLGQVYLVASGLNKGEKIVYEGTQNLRHGNRIRPRNVAAAEALGLAVR